MDVDWHRFHDLGFFLTARDAFNGERELRRPRDGAELRRWRHRRHDILARESQQAALARRAGRLHRRYACLAQSPIANWLFPALRLGLLRIDLRRIADLNGRREALVVRIVNRNAHVHFVGIFEMQHVIGARVRREPEVALDVLSIVLKMWKSLVLSLLKQTC